MPKRISRKIIVAYHFSASSNSNSEQPKNSRGEHEEPTARLSLKYHGGGVLLGPQDRGPDAPLFALTSSPTRAASQFSWPAVPRRKGELNHEKESGCQRSIVGRVRR